MVWLVVGRLAGKWLGGWWWLVWWLVVVGLVLRLLVVGGAGGWWLGLKAVGWLVIGGGVAGG